MAVRNAWQAHILSDVETESEEEGGSKIRRTPHHTKNNYFRLYVWITTQGIGTDQGQSRCTLNIEFIHVDNSVDNDFINVDNSVDNLVDNNVDNRMPIYA